MWVGRHPILFNENEAWTLAQGRGLASTRVPRNIVAGNRMETSLSLCQRETFFPNGRRVSEISLGDASLQR